MINFLSGHILLVIWHNQKKISKSTVEFLDDLFVKPENENWIEYLQVILLKNERYVYFGFILIMFVIFMKFIE